MWFTYKVMRYLTAAALGLPVGETLLLALAVAAVEVEAYNFAPETKTGAAPPRSWRRRKEERNFIVHTHTLSFDNKTRQTKPTNQPGVDRQKESLNHVEREKNERKKDHKITRSQDHQKPEV